MLSYVNYQPQKFISPYIHTAVSAILQAIDPEM